MPTLKLYIWLACLLLTSTHSEKRSSFSESDKRASGIETLDHAADCFSLFLEGDLPEEMLIIERKLVSLEASEKAPPGDIIHVTSGSFQEFLIVDSPELRIIGLPGSEGIRVVMIHPGEIVTRLTLSCFGESVEVTEICLEHFHEKSFRICPGINNGDTTGTPPFTMVRNEISEGLEQYVCELPLRSYERDLIRIFRSKPDDEETLQGTALFLPFLSDR